MREEVRLIDANALKKFIGTYDGTTAQVEAVEVQYIDNAPTVEFPEQITVKCDTEEDRQKLLSALRNARVTRVVEEERPQVDITEEQAIDKLHETGWLPKHDKEMTERPQGKWQHDCSQWTNRWICSECGNKIFVARSNFCPNCGADMRGGRE